MVCCPTILFSPVMIFFSSAQAMFSPCVYGSKIIVRHRDAGLRGQASLAEKWRLRPREGAGFLPRVSGGS